MQGSCLCGEIIFEVSEPIPALYQCHCSLCRKQTGATSNTAMAVNSNQLRWLSDQQLISTFKRETGFTSNFCSKCGSPVPNQIGNSQFIWVPAGLLETTAGLSVATHLFVDSRAAWEALPTNGKCFSEMPGLNEIVGFLYDQANT
ncbi:MAG TPA: GFA family protein [Candidatus Competibacteraceae bacterium]|nr:GFA family protein [Candidatus Competibacteraceae bacterium]HRY19409.1 GFA family protein [Candidatus Competibacteraceae bacterium]